MGNILWSCKESWLPWVSEWNLIHGLWEHALCCHARECALSSSMRVTHLFLTYPSSCICVDLCLDSLQMLWNSHSRVKGGYCSFHRSYAVHPISRKWLETVFLWEGVLTHGIGTCKYFSIRYYLEILTKIVKVIIKKSCSWKQELLSRVQRKVKGSYTSHVFYFSGVNCRKLCIATF